MIGKTYYPLQGEVWKLRSQSGFGIYKGTLCFISNLRTVPTMASDVDLVMTPSLDSSPKMESTNRDGSNPKRLAILGFIARATCTV